MRNRIPLDLMLLHHDAGHARFIRDALHDDPKYAYQFFDRENTGDVRALASDRDFDLLLAFLEPETSAETISFLAGIRRDRPDLPVAVFCSPDHEPCAADAMEAGACDYFLLGSATPLTVQKTVRSAVAQRQKTEMEGYVGRLRKTEESFQKVIRHNKDGIVVVNRDNVIRFLNTTAAALLQGNALELTGKPCAHPLAAEKVFELALPIAGGKTVHVHVQTIPIQWDDEQAFLASLRDITDRIELERKKEDFLNTASHELRTPLTVIREGVSQVEEGLHGPLTDAQKKFLQIARAAAEHLKKIVDDLLDMAKLEVGKMRLHLAQVDLRALLEERAAAFAAIAEKKGLKLRAPAGTGPVHVPADRFRLTQVLDNLISNAVKFTDRGEIELRLTDGQEQAVCEVRDTGRGIPEQDLPRMFSKFEQFGRPQDSTSQGTGLGLPISKNLVELHGGAILVESKVNEGTTFKVVLPKKRGEGNETDHSGGG